MSAVVESLSIDEARRLALRAQCLGAAAAPGAARIKKCLLNLSALQIDSVNVLIRAHYLPLFSRFGPYACSFLDELAWSGSKKRLLFEYWGHEASLLPVGLYPLMRWRMRGAAQGEGIYKGLADFGRQEKSFVRQVLGQVKARGAVSAGDLNKGGATGPWWGWSPEKTALEWLFAAGEVSVSARRGFERLYDLTERVLPPSVVAAPEPRPAEARLGLLLLAAKALGVATEKDLRAYFRLPPAGAKAALAEALNSGELREVQVEGWPGKAYALKDFSVPRRVSASTFVSPFDSLIWERDRCERLFNFRYRLEFYTPPAKRIYGYHVLPFLHGDRLVGRADLKAERGAGFLRVISVYSEEPELAENALEAMADNLKQMANWLNLTEVRVNKKGRLEKRLEKALL